MTRLIANAPKANNFKLSYNSPYVYYRGQNLVLVKHDKKKNMHISRNFETYDYLVTLMVLNNFVETQSIILHDFSIDGSCLVVFQRR